MDECTDGTHTCDVHASCENEQGGHQCQCTDGFEGDGENCEGRGNTYSMVV